ncbi:MAG: MFS transporter [Planctomycetes bacterium]|nr:MFS transporter [Planctomycetota bacterium]MCH9725447.1 MFS transporter [Planctomycetota bacterium]MCH9776544.1 MFS transporter [Planctomycetota bacterium]MCH9789559.1 MFS transporter [Planctomycetota bacterium]MDF1742319.1 MFS transporter [Gimesia sp.]
MAKDPTRNWQRLTLLSLFLGYVGYYICRSNLAVATPLLLKEGFTKVEMGTVASVGVMLYAIGKIINGYLGDFLGGKLLFMTGMICSIIFTILFGLVSGLTLFVIIWAFNRFVQSMGWVALVKTASRWFPVERHATVMAILSLSFLFGDAFARFYLGGLISLGESYSALGFLANWRAIFFVAAISLTLIAVFVYRTLKSSPNEVGIPEPSANPINVFGEEGNHAERISIKAVLEPLMASPLFWLICIMNFSLTLVRETFNFWTPTFLYEVAQINIGGAAMGSMLFPLVGGCSTYLAGITSDRLRGRHGRVVLPSLILLVLSLILLATVDVSGKPVLALTLLSLVAFFLMAPYSFLSGVMAIDLGGKRGCSTVAGLVDSAGYLGAILSGHTVGWIAQKYGWKMAFGGLAGICCTAILAGIVYWLIQEREMNLAEVLSSESKPEAPDA